MNLPLRLLFGGVLCAAGGCRSHEMCKACKAKKPKAKKPKAKKEEKGFTYTHLLKPPLTKMSHSFVQYVVYPF